MNIFRSFQKRFGKKCSVKVKELLEQYPQYEIGRGTYGSLEIVTWQEGATLKMGAFCSLAEGVKIILGGEHRVDWVTTYPFSYFWEKGQHITGAPHDKG